MFLLASVSVSSFQFQPPPANSASDTCCRAFPTPGRGYPVGSYTRCFATPKGNSDKISNIATNKISGIGGLNVGNSPPLKSKTIDNKTTVVRKPKAVIASKPINTTIPKTPSKNKESVPTEISWSKIILAFLIPWRNPNSLFLYMLLIVSVLGKLNENPH